MSVEMFNVLCEQMATLADAQTRDRQRAGRENRENLDLITQSMAQFSRQLVAKHPDTTLPAANRQQLSAPTPVGVYESVQPAVCSSRELTGPSVSSAGSRARAAQPAPGTSECYVLPRASQPDRLTAQTSTSEGDQVRTLRRHRPSANNAAAILRELALLEADGKKNSGGTQKNNTQVEADWPDLYVYRMQGGEPTYDSLSLPEFVAGYLSIIEEATSICTLNTQTYSISSPINGGLLYGRLAHGQSGT